MAKTEGEKRLKKHSIPKKYLSDRKFSYKFYLYMVNSMFWHKVKDNNMNIQYEYFLNYLSIKKISEESIFGKYLIREQIKNRPYRIKKDENGDSHLYINSPTNNYLRIKRETIDKLLEYDELTIRAYLFLMGFEYNVIYGLNNKKILGSVGYCDTSTSNEDKLGKGIGRLIKDNMIERELEFNGHYRKTIYTKVKQD